MKYLLTITLALAFWGPAAAQQAESPTAHAHLHASAEAASANRLAEGEVRRIDKERQRITIRHGVIPSLDMPAMTMVFQVRDGAMLDQVQVGQKVRFDAERKGGTYTVTHLEVAK